MEGGSCPVVGEPIAAGSLGLGWDGVGTGGYHIEITCVRELQCNYSVISRVVFQLHVICMPYV